MTIMTESIKMDKREILMRIKRHIICHEKTNIYGMEMKIKSPRKILISNDAVADPEFGWVCDCGRWHKISVDWTGKHTHELVEN